MPTTVKKQITLQLQKTLQRKLDEIGKEVKYQIIDFLNSKDRITEVVEDVIVGAIKLYARTLLGIETGFDRLTVKQNGEFAKLFQARVKAMFNRVVRNAGWTEDRFTSLVEDEIKKQIGTKRFERAVKAAIKDHVADLLWEFPSQSARFSGDVLENILSNLDLEIVIEDQDSKGGAA